MQAARIGEEANPIATISAQYDSLAKEIRSETKAFMGAGELVRHKVQDCQFDICNALLQREIYRFFESETKETPIDKSKEMSILAELSQRQLAKAGSSLRDIEKEFASFKKVHEEVRQLAAALEIVCLTGKIEAAKISNDTGSLAKLLGDLVIFKNSLKDSLLEIQNIGDSLIRQTRQMSIEIAG